MGIIVAMTAAEILRDAREKWKAGATEDAYRALLSLFSATASPLVLRADFQDALGLLAELSRAFGAAELAGKVAKCASSPDDAQALYDAAYGLYEQKQFAAGATLLFRANQIAPGQPSIVSELCGCLEHLLRYREAALVVDASGLAETDAVCAYLSGYGWLMSGDLDVPRRRVAALAGAAGEPISFMQEALSGMLARADALLAAEVALGERELSAWQAVIDGTVLLHESPHGYAEPMRGRYAFLSDTPTLIREAIERLGWLHSWQGERFAHVVAAPGRQSRIVARAAARMFELPCVDWTRGAEEQGLVVAWSMESVEDDAFIEALHSHRPGQRLWFHASCWTEPFPYAPDVTTVLHQMITDPWTGGALRIDPETQSVKRAEPDPRSDDELAEEIVRVPVDENRSVTAFTHVQSIVRALASVPEPYRAGIHRTKGKRLHQRAGGPVQSARFG